MDVEWAANNDLDITANNNITQDSTARFVTTGSGNISFTADGDIQVSTLTSANGNVNLVAGGDILDDGTNAALSAVTVNLQAGGAGAGNVGAFSTPDDINGNITGFLDITQGSTVRINDGDTVAVAIRSNTASETAVSTNSIVTVGGTAESLAVAAVNDDAGNVSDIDLNAAINATQSLVLIAEGEIRGASAATSAQGEVRLLAA